MRKKILLRGSALVLAALVVAALIIPYSRQWLFGPKYGGVPLCAWQDRLRQQVVPDAKDDFVAKVFRWFQPKNASLPADKLTRQEKIDIWLTLLDDPIPAVRARSVQTLWGGALRGMDGSIWLDHYSFSVISRSYISTGPINVNKYFVNAAGSLSVWSGDAFPIGLTFDSIHPPCDVAPHLVRMIDDPDADVRNAVFAALSSQGKKAEPAFPRLFELLNHEDAERRRKAASALNDTHPKTRNWLDRLTAMLGDGDAKVRGHIAGCLQAWHDQRLAVAAGPALTRALRDADPIVRLRSATALGALGLKRHQASETIRAGLRDAAVDVRQHAMSYLFDSGNQDALLADLTRCVRSDPDPGVRRGAISTLRVTGAKAVPLLVTLLQHPVKETRQTAIGALSTLGADARAAVPFLIAGLEDDFAAERLEALGCIGHADAVPKLIELLDDGGLRPQALSALERLGTEARAAAPRLVKLLEFGAVEDCQRAARCLISMNMPADELVPMLLPLLRHGASQTYHQAAMLLAQLDPHHEDTLPALKRLAFEVKQNIRTDVFQALRGLGPGSRPLLPLLQQRLKDGDEAMRVQCLQLLGAIGPDAAPAVPALMRLAEPPDAALGAFAIAALGNIAAAEEKVIPLLIRLLQKEDTMDAALEALAGFGPRAAAALPDVLPMLKSERSGTRVAAAQTLSKIVRRPEDALAHLTPMLRDEDENMRRQLARLLGDLGPAAVGSLCVLLDDDSQRIYEAALDALARIEP